MYNSILQAIGNTPLIQLNRLEKELGLNAKIAVKAERFNPAGSVKDRAALYIITEAEKSGALKAGGTVIEATSGNTGIGLAAICAAKGYRAIFTMPESMSIERRKLIKAYGAEIVLTEPAKGMQGAIDKAEELSKTISGAIIAGQFINKANVKAHYETTGPEIWRDTNGEIAAFVAGVGSGGTLSGVGKYLKEKSADIHIVAVEPFKSPLLSGGKSASHGIMGLGANFVPEILDRNIYNEVICATEESAYSYARLLAEKEGILAGISSGAALWAACELAKRPQMQGKLIVAVLPDTGERYLSTELFSE